MTRLTTRSVPWAFPRWAAWQWALARPHAPMYATIIDLTSFRERNMDNASVLEERRCVNVIVGDL